MNAHEHSTKNTPENKPAQDEVAKKAYAIYVKEGRPQGRDVQNWVEAETGTPHAGADHHSHMAADFRKRFWISLVLTVPILVLSPMLQMMVGLREAIRFPATSMSCSAFLPRSSGTAAGRFSMGCSRSSSLASPG